MFDFGNTRLEITISYFFEELVTLLNATITLLNSKQAGGESFSGFPPAGIESEKVLGTKLLRLRGLKDYSGFGKGHFLPSIVMEHSVTEVRNAGYDSQEETSLAVTSTS